MIAKCSLARETNRVPIGRNDRRSAETDSVRMLCPPSQHLQGIRRDNRLDGVMLGGPRSLEAAAIRHLHELQRLPRHVIHPLAWIEALHIDRYSELHCALSGVLGRAILVSAP